MRPSLALLATLVFAAAPLAGCFGAEAVPDGRAVTASNGKVSLGWDYAGATVAAASATLSGSVNNPDNAGAFEVSFEHAGSTWTVVFDTFAQADGKPYMDGGVAFELDEHGDSGVADASIPKILAKIAAWGSASVARDGVPVTSFDGSDARWSAHLMVSDTTVRGADGRILKADGATPYDPAAPGDAARVEGDPQALLKLVHPDGESAARAPVAFTQAVQFQGPESTQAVPVEVAAGVASVVVNVTAGASAPLPVGAGTLTARVLDTEGTELASNTGNVLPNQPLAFSFPLEGVTGPLTVELVGEGAYSAAVDAVVSYDDHPLLVLTWDEVEIA